MYVRPNRPGLFRLSLGGALLAAELIEGRPHYHGHADVHFLAFGKYAIESYTTSSATTALKDAMLSTEWRRR
jgi:hypothetical protein